MPDRLIGVWRRLSFAVEGAPASEDSRVVWIQGRTRFADVRTPAEGAPAGVEPMSFSGHASWEAPRLRFYHTVDLNRPVDDVGTLSWRGDDLVERGQLEWEDRTLAFEEVWRRTPLRGDVLLALELRSEEKSGQGRDVMGALLRLGSHAIVTLDRRALGLDYSAAYLEARDGGGEGKSSDDDDCNWQVRWSIGDARQLPLPPDLDRVPPEGDTFDLPVPALSSTTRWFVAERGIVPGHTS